MNESRATVLCDRIGDHLTIYLSGELDCASVQELESSVVPRLHPTDRRVWVDLSAVTFCASAGLRLLVQLHELVEAQGGHLTLYAPSPIVVRAIQVCGLGEVLSISHPLSALG